MSLNLALAGERTQQRILVALLVLCVVWFWILPLGSSFWIDEGVTAFVVHFPHHPSFGAAPQVPQSLYYWLPRLAGWIVGDVRSLEVAYRIPSMLAMGLALFLLSRLAARLIHPAAGWFAVFAALMRPGINYAAIDARPYGLGILVSTASVFFLARWLDRARFADSALFVVCAVMLWPVHLVYWPFYAVYVVYVVARFIAGDTPVRKFHGVGAFAVIGAALVPVAMNALVLVRQAGAHTVAELPGPLTFAYGLNMTPVVLTLVGVWVCKLRFGWTARGDAARPALFLVSGRGGWWFQTVSIFLYSHITGNSLYIPRYLSLLLPGVALSATFVVGCWLPADRWKLAAIAMALVALLTRGQWTAAAFQHEDSDWRAASAEVNRFAADGITHVLCISPFVEARAPVWTRDYQLPGFLYSHLYPYPVHSIIDPLPALRADGLDYARMLAQDVLPQSRRFAIYGVYVNTVFWRDWFANLPQFAGWQVKTAKYGYVQVVEFTRP